MEKGRRVRNMVGNQTPSAVTYKWEGWHRQGDPLRGVRGSRTTSGSQPPTALLRCTPITSGFKNQWDLNLGEPKGYRILRLNEELKEKIKKIPGNK